MHIIFTKKNDNFILFLSLQIRNALKEQQEVNTQLRDYIDGILTNIIMQHPELLEVKKWKKNAKEKNNNFFLLPVDVILKAKLCK